MKSILLSGSILCIMATANKKRRGLTVVSTAFYNNVVSKAITTDFTKAHLGSDVIFLVENYQVHAHKMDLMRCSPVFQAMFSGNFKESVESKPIALPGKSYLAVLRLVQILTPPGSPLTDADVEYILPLIREYQIIPKFAVCETLLLEREVDADLLKLAVEYLNEMPALSKKVEKEYSSKQTSLNEIVDDFRQVLVDSDDEESTSPLNMFFNVLERKLGKCHKLPCSSKKKGRVLLGDI